MLCDICKKKEAKIYYTEIIQGEKKEQHLCEECAAKNSAFKAMSPFAANMFSVGGMIFGMLSDPIQSETAAAKAQDQCPTCQMTYEEFLEKGKFGCEDCYKSFGKTLSKNLKSIHGAEIHTGKKPKNFISEMAKRLSEMSETEKLSIKLQQAVEQEEYEQAAKLRDQIRELKAKESKKQSV